MSTEITSEFIWHNIPPRPRDSHKGSFGTVLAVAGSAYYRGAALLAAEGALRTGVYSCQSLVFSSTFVYTCFIKCKFYLSIFSFACQETLSDHQERGIFS